MQSVRLTRLVCGVAVCLTLQATLAFAQTRNTQSTTGRTTTGTTNQTPTSTTGANSGQQQQMSLSGPQISELGSLSEQMSTGFIGRNTDGTFVGANQSTQNNLAATQTQNRNQNVTRVNQNQFQQPNNQQTQQPSRFSSIVYRPPHRVAFTAPARRSGAIETRLTTLAQKFAKRGKPEFAGIQIAVADDNTVTLTGIVPDAEARQMAQLMTQMEPGVYKVVNQLEVAAASAETP